MITKRRRPQLKAMRELHGAETNGAILLSGLTSWNDVSAKPSETPDTKIMTGTVRVCDDGTMCAVQEIGNSR